MKRSCFVGSLTKGIQIDKNVHQIPKCESVEQFFTLNNSKRKKKGTTFRNLSCSITLASNNPEHMGMEQKKIPFEKLSYGDAKTAVTDDIFPDNMISFKKKSPKKKINKIQLKNENTKKQPQLSNQLSRQKISIDDFQVFSKFGEGSYSQVYAAIQKNTGFICALKKMNKKLIKESQLIQVLIREIKIHSHLKHQNILDFYGVFDDADNIYLIEELCIGGDLYRMLKSLHKNGDEMERQEIVVILRQLCKALESMHVDYLMHRDIKPENIFFGMGNVVKLGDFGWSVYFGNQAMRNTQCGTPLYLAPQLVGNKEYNETVDIWAIGVLAYELLTGQNPFDIKKVEDLNKVIHQQINFEFIEDDLARDFVKKLLERKVDLRMEIEDVLDHQFLKIQDQNPIVMLL